MAHHFLGIRLDPSWVFLSPYQTASPRIHRFDGPVSPQGWKAPETCNHELAFLFVRICATMISRTSQVQISTCGIRQPSWWPGWGFQEPKLPENQLPDGPVPVPTTVSDAETCQALMLGLFIDTVVSWVIGVPPVIIHFERWDFPWNKPTILDTPFFGNHHIWCF